MAPYFIGVALCLHWIELKERKGFITVTQRVCLYILAAFFLLSTVYGTFNSTENLVYHWDQTKNVFYLAFSRTGFVLGVAILSFLAFRGYGGVISYFLGSSVWNPFARLTYLAYLLHPVILVPIDQSWETEQALTPLSIGIFFISFVVLSYAAASIVWLLLEKPLMNLEKLWIPVSVSERENRRKEISGN